MSVRTEDPSTGQLLREFDVYSAAKVEETLAQSFEAYNHWRRLDLATRLKCIKDLEDSLKAQRQELAEQVSREMGKVLSEALAEVDKCVASCAQLRELFPIWKKEQEYTVGEFSVHYEPLGPILAIMPWNYPLWQVLRFAVPALLNGNTFLLKHAPNTWGVAEMLVEHFSRALPFSVFTNLFIEVDQIPALIADQRIRGVSLTGSRSAGSKVGALAGQHLKKCVLELGGSDAYVILDDADVGKAAAICARGRLINAGQSCVAAKRFIVTEKNAKAFTEALVEAMKVVRWGNPFEAKTDIGPLARKDLRDGLHDQVQRTVAKGGRLLLGGQVPDDSGFYYPPSVITGVEPGQAAFDEELFGPVAAIISAKDEVEAVKLANRSRYGLGGALFSRDVERARAMALKEMEAGMVFVNDFVRSDARVPFGGIKDSGLGRELGREGCFEFCNIKTLKF